jgi:hypothetical protein
VVRQVLAQEIETATYKELKVIIEIFKKLSRKRKSLIVQGNSGTIIDIVMKELCYFEYIWGTPDRYSGSVL